MDIFYTQTHTRIISKLQRFGTKKMKIGYQHLEYVNNPRKIIMAESDEILLCFHHLLVILNFFIW